MSRGKKCSKCRITKPLIEFYKNRKNKTSWCKSCYHQRDIQTYKTKEGREKKIISVRNYHKTERGKLKHRRALCKKYGITLVQYNELFIIQDGVCAICQQKEICCSSGQIPDNLSIDHCHKTGKIRGLLCRRCNNLLGWANDNCILLSRAIVYLKGGK